MFALGPVALNVFGWIIVVVEVGVMGVFVWASVKAHRARNIGASAVAPVLALIALWIAICEIVVLCLGIIFVIIFVATTPGAYATAWSYIGWVFRVCAITGLFMIRVGAVRERRQLFASAIGLMFLSIGFDAVEVVFSFFGSAVVWLDVVIGILYTCLRIMAYSYIAALVQVLRGPSYVTVTSVPGVVVAPQPVYAVSAQQTVAPIYAMPVQQGGVVYSAPPPPPAAVYPAMPVYSAPGIQTAPNDVKM